MSRPIYEPSLPRADAELGYGNRQLFRRPAPTVEGTDVGYPSVYRETTTLQSVAANSAGLGIHWDAPVFENGGATYFQAHPTIPDEFIRIKGTALWLIEFHFQIKWEDNFNSFYYMMVECGAFGWFPYMTCKEPYGANGTPVRGDVSPVLAFERKMPTGTSDVGLQVCHENGSSRNIENAWMRLAFKTVYVGTAETAW